MHCFDDIAVLSIKEPYIRFAVPVDKEDIRVHSECKHELSWEGGLDDENEDKEGLTHHGTKVEEFFLLRQTGKEGARAYGREVFG